MLRQTEIARKDLLFGFDESSDFYYWAKVDSAMDTLSFDATYVIQGRGEPRTPSLNASILNKPFKVWAEGTGFGGVGLVIFILPTLIQK